MKVPPSFKEEHIHWRNGAQIVIGIDEVGRGAFAGPLVVGAVVFSPSFLTDVSWKTTLADIRDSKMLSATKRESLCNVIKKFALATSIAEITVGTINRVGIGQANQMGFRKAITQIRVPFLGKKTFLLVDGFHARYAKGIGLRNQKAIVKGDQKSLTIAAASIIAKVHRDSIMEKLAKNFPLYHFELHKGYGTALHRDALTKNGLSSVHRTQFVRNLYT